MICRILGCTAALIAMLLLSASHLVGVHAEGTASYVARAPYPDSTSRLQVDISPGAKRPGYIALTAVRWRLYTPLVRSRYCEIVPQGMITIAGPKTKDFPFGARYKLPFTAVLPIEGKKQHTVRYAFPPSTFQPKIPSGFVSKGARVTLVWLVRTFSKPCATARTHLGPKHVVSVKLP